MAIAKIVGQFVASQKTRFYSSVSRTLGSQEYRTKNTHSPCNILRGDREYPLYRFIYAPSLFSLHSQHDACCLADSQVISTFSSMTSFFPFTLSYFFLSSFFFYSSLYLASSLTSQGPPIVFSARSLMLQCSLVASMLESRFQASHSCLEIHHPTYPSPPFLHPLSSFYYQHHYPSDTTPLFFPISLLPILRFGYATRYFSTSLSWNTIITLGPMPYFLLPSPQFLSSRPRKFKK